MNDEFDEIRTKPPGMCTDRLEIWRDCKHSRQSFARCDAWKAEQRRVEGSGCCFGSRERTVCVRRGDEVKYPGLCLECTYSQRQQHCSRPIRPGSRPSRNNRDSLINDPELYTQAMHIASSGDFNMYMRAPRRPVAPDVPARPAQARARPGRSNVPAPVSVVSVGSGHAGRVSPLGRGKYDYDPSRQSVLFEEVEEMWRNA